MSFHLDIVSLKGNIFSGLVESVTVPGEEGTMTVLGHHMPIVTYLTIGEVEVKGEKNLDLSIGKGILTMAGNTATLLVEDEQAIDEISEKQASEAKEKAEEIIKKGATGEEKTQAMYALRKSLVDLKLARKKRKTRL
jgi:F-type H+-transporting ATPase subunit epsilon